MGALNFDPFAGLAEANANPGSGLPEPKPARAHDLSGSEFSRLAALAGVEGQNQREAAPSPREAGEKQETLDALAEKPIPSVSDETQKRGWTPAKNANLLNSADAPQAWRDGFARLDPNRPPKGFPSTWWREVIRDSELFLARWARQAADLGWSELDVFGCHKTAPSANYAAMGLALLIRGGRIVALTADRAIIEQASGSRLTFTRQSPEQDAVPMWDAAP